MTSPDPTTEMETELILSNEKTQTVHIQAGSNHWEQNTQENDEDCHKKCTGGIQQCFMNKSGNMEHMTKVLNELKDDIVISSLGCNRDFRLSSKKYNGNDVPVDGKVYIQQNESFRELTKDEIVTAQEFGNQRLPQILENKLISSIDAAIAVQNITQLITNLCYGLLGGVSFMQLLFACASFNGSEDEVMTFIKVYSKLADITTASFSVLTTICFVFTCDRVDLLRIKRMFSQNNDLCFNHWMLLVIYGSMLITSAVCFRYDEIILFYANKEDQFIVNDVMVWRILNFWRSILGLTGWFLICLTKPTDLLECYLNTLRKSFLTKTVSRD